MTPSEIDKVNTDDPYEQASSWFLRLSNGEINEDDPELRAWLSASPENAEAMSSVRVAWWALSEHANAPEMQVARRDALAQATKSAANRWGASGGWLTLTKAIAASLAIIFVVGSVVVWQATSIDNIDIASDPAPSFETGVGETRVVTLSDNSKVSLDASTRLRVDYTLEARAITLLAGQAHFDVAKDPARPFRVTAGDQTVVATGTAFNVEIVDEDVFVTLIEGEVVVADTDDIENGSDSVSSPTSSRSPGDAVILRPGEQLVASAEALSEPVVTPDVNIEKATAWRRGMIMLDDDPLTAAVARMNRYSKIRLVVADEELDQLKISGVFSAGDTDAFIEALEAYFPIRAARISSDRIELHDRG